MTAIGNEAVTCNGKQQLVNYWSILKAFQVLALLGSPDGLKAKVKPNWGARGSQERNEGVTATSGQRTSADHAGIDKQGHDQLLNDTNE